MFLPVCSFRFIENLLLGEVRSVCGVFLDTHLGVVLIVFDSPLGSTDGSGSKLLRGVEDGLGRSQCSLFDSHFNLKVEEFDYCSIEK